MTVGFIGGKFLPLHQGHVYAITQASTMVDKLYVVLSYSKKRDEELCRRDGCKHMPYQVRLSWLSRMASDVIIPIAVEDSHGNEDYDWEEGAELIKKAIGEKIDYIFGSEPEYQEIFRQNYPRSEYILIDEKRVRVPISATQIRKDVYRHWDMLPSFVKPYFVKKIVVIGTESCGKSTLVKNLAKIYNTTFVEELGRRVCAEIGGPECLTEDVYRRIAYGHKLLEHKAVQEANKILFIDTESLVTQYYAGLYNEYKDNLFDEMAKHQDYDLWIYLEPDVGWVDDGQRKHGEDEVRGENNRKLKRMLEERGIQFHIIKGGFAERLEQSMVAVDGVFGWV